MPNPFTKKIRQAGLLIVGGLLTVTGYGVSKITTGGTSLPDVSQSGGVERVTTFVASNELNAQAIGTGSTTIKYPSACIPNPLARLSPSQGSGVVIRLSYENITSPAGIGGDIGFVKSCGDGGGSGQTLINDVCTATGCASYYTTGTALWNGADYIKFTPRGNLTAGFDARIRATYEDIAGE